MQSALAISTSESVGKKTDYTSSAWLGEKFLPLSPSQFICERVSPDCTTDMPARLTSSLLY